MEQLIQQLIQVVAISSLALIIILGLGVWELADIRKELQKINKKE